jgi:hypothetical protein
MVKIRALMHTLEEGPALLSIDKIEQTGVHPEQGLLLPLVASHLSSEVSLING